MVGGFSGVKVMNRWFPLEFVLGKKEYHVPEEFQQLTNDALEQSEHVGETVTMELRGLTRGTYLIYTQ